MTRAIMAEGCREIDIRGTRYYAGHGTAAGYRQGGSFDDMDPAHARLVVKAGGAIASEAGTTRRGLGYRCPACGFGSFLKRCSRCGAECERE